MLTVERQRGILRYLERNRAAHIASLAESLGVSPSTIRRDLNELAASGLIRRVRGGAVNGDTTEATESVASERAFAYSDEKQRIAAAAAALVPSYSTIFISGGTTTERLVPLIGDVESLVVITNGIAIGSQLAALPSVESIVLGGSLRHSELTLHGGMTEQAVRQYRIDVAFYGCYGIDPESGLSGASMLEAATDRAVIAAARRLVVLADSSKFAQRGPAHFADVEQIAAVVTDQGVPPATVARLRESGVEVVVA